MGDGLGAQGLPDAEVAAIKDVVETWTHALVAQDFDNWVTYWAEDGVLMPPDHDRVVGHSQLLAYMEANFMELESITFSDWNVVGRDDLAIVANSFIVTPKSARRSGMPEVGKQIIVLRTNDDGRWLVHSVIFNLDHSD